MTINTTGNEGGESGSSATTGPSPTRLQVTVSTNGGLQILTGNDVGTTPPPPPPPATAPTLVNGHHQEMSSTPSANCKVVGFAENTEHFPLPSVDDSSNVVCAEILQLSPSSSASGDAQPDDWKAALARDISDYGRQFDREIARHSSTTSSCTSSSRPESRTSGGHLSRASTSASSHASNTSGVRLRKSPTNCSSGGDSAEEHGRRSVSPPMRELLSKPVKPTRHNYHHQLTQPHHLAHHNSVHSTPLGQSHISVTRPKVPPGHSPLTVSKASSHHFQQQRPHQNGQQQLTPYERIRIAMQNDRTWAKEVAFGRRIGMYRFRGDVGNGNFSTVKFATHSLSKEKVAIKILDKTKLDAKTQRMLGREIRTMETVHHPHLIRIFEVIETLSKHYLVMELAPGGELFQVISQQGRFAETEAKFYFAQIVSAIDHMHQHNLIHRDIKAENVFFSDPYTIKVGDFGFSTCITGRDELLSTFCGSPPYAAPELFRDEHYRGPFVDYWALGVLLHFMVTGQMPFRAQTIVALKRLILECRYDIPLFVSFECCQLIAGFLQKDPSKRYTLEQARATRWMRNQAITKSAPKYDLKSAFAKLVRERRTVQLQRHSSVGELFFVSNNSSSTDESQIGVATATADANNNNKRLNRMSLIETKSTSAPPPKEKAALQSPVKTSKKHQLTDAERKSFRQLMALGIDTQLIAENLDRGSLSPIAGTFRILMHRNVHEHIRNGSHNSGRTAVKALDRTKSAPNDQFWDKYAQKQTQVISKKESSNKPPTESTTKTRLPFIAKSRTTTDFVSSKDQKSSSKTSTDKRKESSTKIAPAPVTPTADCLTKSKVSRKTSGTSLSRSWKTLNNLVVNGVSAEPKQTERTETVLVIEPEIAKIEQQSLATKAAPEPRQIVHETTMMNIVPTVNQSGCTAVRWPPSFASKLSTSLKRSQTTPNVSTCHKASTADRAMLKHLQTAIPVDDGKNRCTIF